MKKPELFVIGAPKCGTTALYEYLSQSDSFFMPLKKELHFFSREHLNKCCNGPGDKFVLKEVPRSEIEYMKWFDKDTNTDSVKAVDVSPSYLYFPVEKEIYDFNKEAKVLVLLRSPIQKAYSQYVHLMFEGREELSFSDALDAESIRIEKGYSDFWRYQQSSLYYDRVKSYENIFGNNFKVVIFEDFINDPQKIVDELCDWLAVPRYDLVDKAAQNVGALPKSRFFSKLLLGHNRFTWIVRRLLPVKLGKIIRAKLISLNSDKKERLDKNNIDYLSLYFDDDIKKLEKMLGRELPWR